MTKQIKFISKVLPGALKAQEEYGVLASVTLSQAILESGWGQSELASKYNNFFGIKATTDWKGKVINYDSNEYLDSGVTKMRSAFRVYTNLEDSILDHAKFLMRPRYVQAGLLNANDYEGQIDSIIRGGYCTSPDYKEQLVRIIKTYKLYEYDKGVVNMKVAVRGGHNFLATGARAIIDETTEDRKVKDAVIKYLRQRGVSVLDVTPGKMSQKADLAYGINKAKEWGADMFFSIHFDNCYKSYEGALGTSVILRSLNNSMRDPAKRVNDHLVGLGFKRHGAGVIADTGLYELNHFNSSMIIEVCYVEATEDVATYRRVGADIVGKAIVEGLLDVKIGDSSPVSNTSNTKTTNDSLDGRIGVVATSGGNLNIRSLPSTEGSIIGSLPKGATVKLFKDKGNGWYEIYYGAHGGFVSKDYIRLA